MRKLMLGNFKVNWGGKGVYFPPTSDTRAPAGCDEPRGPCPPPRITAERAVGGETLKNTADKLRWNSNKCSGGPWKDEVIKETETPQREQELKWQSEALTYQWLHCPKCSKYTDEDTVGGRVSSKA